MAWHEGAIWIDLTDDRWRAVRVSTDGWEIVDDPPILFRRFNHQSAQVEPQRGGSLDLLRNHLPLNDSDLLLLTVYLVTSLVPDIPHPIVHPHGEKGAGKTVLSRMCRRLVDPSDLEVASFPSSLNDLVQMLSHHYMPVFDNVDGLSPERSDVLCRAVTGEGFSKRAHYTNDDDFIYHYLRCPLLNGINIAAQRPDLLDRTILIELGPIPPGRRKTESELFAAFERDRALILGAMLDTLSTAMGSVEDLYLPSHTRMADFERWGVAAVEAVGKEGQHFLAVYQSNRLALTEEAIAGDPTGQCVLEFMEGRGDWEGTPALLYEEVKRIAEDQRLDRANGFPKAPNAMSRRLRTISGNLREVGIEVTWSKSGSRKIILREAPNNTVHTAQSTKDGDDSADDTSPVF